MNRQIHVTIIISVRNENGYRAQLRRCSEVIVVDSLSNDRTPQIAREHGARYVNSV